MLLLQEQETEAEATVQTIQSLRPNDVEVYIILGDIYQFHGYVDGAIAHYQQALALNPRNTEAQDKLTEADSLQLQQGSPE